VADAAGGTCDDDDLVLKFVLRFHKVCSHDTSAAIRNRQSV